MKKHFLSQLKLNNILSDFLLIQTNTGSMATSRGQESNFKPVVTHTFDYQRLPVEKAVRKNGNSTIMVDSNFYSPVK
jgi:hypothetical protein